jgi:hypothetical protein
MAGHSMSEKENLLFPATEDFDEEPTPEIPSNRRSRLALKTWFLLCIIIVSVAANILQAGFILWREASSYACGLKSECTLAMQRYHCPLTRSLQQCRMEVSTCP